MSLSQPLRRAGSSAAGDLAVTQSGLGELRDSLTEVNEFLASEGQMQRGGDSSDEGDESSLEKAIKESAEMVKRTEEDVSRLQEARAQQLAQLGLDPNADLAALKAAQKKLMPLGLPQ